MIGAPDILFATVSALSLGFCLLILHFPAWFLDLRHLQKDLAARQALHNRPTPRIGGVAIFLALGIGCFLMREQLGKDLLVALATGSIVFAVGLREDLRHDVSPRLRLMAAFFAAALAVFLSGQWITGLGLGPADMIFQWGLLIVGVTLLWSAGSCHALNLIDGLNGLAAGYTLFAAAGFWVIAGYTGDSDIQLVAGLLIAAVLGFLVVNWPSGAVFMGDAGAYTLGHVLGWLGILLIARNPEVAGIALMLVMFWPIGETTYSMIRRRIQRKATGQPDRMHFHHLVVRALALLFSGGQKLPWQNPVASVVMVPLYAAPVGAGVLFWDQGWSALAMVLIFTGMFIVSYVWAMRFFSSPRFRRHGIAAGRRAARQPAYWVPPAE